MHILPNGQNIQFLPMVNLDKAPSANPPTPKPTKAVKGPDIPKEVAPHMNRHQRRAKAAELKAQAKKQAAELAKKEIAKQARELVANEQARENVGG